MAVSLKDLDIDKLSVPEKLALVDAIWESIELDSVKPPVSDSQIEELRRREQIHAANPTAGTPWSVVKERLGNREVAS